MFLIVLLYALFAGTFSLGKYALAYTQPMFMVGVRMTIAGALILGYLFYTNRKKFNIKREDLYIFAQIIIFNVFIPYITRFWGLKYMSSCKACLIYNFSPFLTFIFSYLLASERVTIKKVIGLLIGFFGLLPIILQTNDNCPTGYTSSWIGLPELAMLISITSFSYGWILVHRLIKRKKYSPFLTNGVAMSGGGFLALISSVCFECKYGLVTDLVPFITMMAIIIVISNLICHNLYGFLLRKYSPTMLSFASFLTPIFAALYGWMFMGEAISLQFMLCSAVIFCGLALFYQDELKYSSFEDAKDRKIKEHYEEAELIETPEM